MKKLFTMMAIASMVMVTNAASINWQLGTGPDNGPVYTAYLFYQGGAPASSANLILWATLLDGIGKYGEANYNPAGKSFAVGQSIFSQTLEEGEISTNNSLPGLFMSGATPNLYMVIFYSETKVGALGEGEYFYYIASAEAGLAFNMTNDGGWAYNYNTTWNGTGAILWDFQPIPEPATMALLGIGVVALGLRRRRK